MKCCTKTVHRFWKGAFIAALGALCAVHGAPAFACPSCKEALGDGLSKGFYWSVLWMLGMTFLVVAAIAGVILRSQRKTSQAALAEEDER